VADVAREAPGFFDADERLAELSAKGDGLARLNALVWRQQLRDN
jgi:hypothetical protein